MKLSREALDFINAPDTVDFITTATQPFLDFARDSRRVLMTEALGSRFVLCYVKEKDLSYLLKTMGSSFISSASVVLGTLGRPALEASGILQVQNQPYLGLRGRGVLVGLVDTGIDYTQPVFRYEDGTTKIRYLYDEAAQGSPPEGFSQGVEYTGEEIDRALLSPDPFQVVPERDAAGHGTFLASVIAGRSQENFLGAAPDAELIVVKLRPCRPYYRSFYCVPPSQQEAYESSAVMVGVQYILERARALGRPVVICLGLGTNFGSHDGSSVFCQYLREVSAMQGVCLVCAAGNEGQERHHTDGRLPAAGQTRSIDLKVGDRAGSIFLSLWNTIPDRLSVSIRSPTGELVRRVPAKPGRKTEASLTLEGTRVQVEYLFPLEGSGGQETILRLLDAAPGIWTITLHGDIILDGTYHAWLPMTGFVSPSVEFLSSTPDFTLTPPATTRGLLCCGAYSSEAGSLWPRSSRGPSWDGAPLPDLTAPGAGVAGIFPYGPGAMSGTSAAAAVTAGAAALLLQWGIVDGLDPTMSTHQIRAYLIRGCLRAASVRYPSPQWGYGTLQLMNAFHLMRDLE